MAAYYLLQTGDVQMGLHHLGLGQLQWMASPFPVVKTLQVVVYVGCVIAARAAGAGLVHASVTGIMGFAAGV